MNSNNSPSSFLILVIIRLIVDCFFVSEPQITKGIKDLQFIIINPILHCHWAKFFHVGRGGGEETSPLSNSVIFEDRDLKFGDNVHYYIQIKFNLGTMPDFLLENLFLLNLCILGHKKVIKQQYKKSLALLSSLFLL